MNIQLAINQIDEKSASHILMNFSICSCVKSSCNISCSGCENKMYLPFTFRPTQSSPLPSDYRNTTKTRDEYGVRDPKTRNSIRTNNISIELTEHLAKFKTWCIETKKLYGSELLDSDYVFITANLEPISSGYIVQMFHAFNNKHQIERFSAHVLRHTYVSILIAEGVPVTTVAKIIGDTPEMVMKAYAHSLADEEL